MNININSRLKKIKILITDVDGVMTDGIYVIGSDGTEYKSFSAQDGAGIAILKAADFPLAVISGRNSGATAFRMRELGIEENLYQGNLAKLEPYGEIKKRFNVSDEEVAYVGDDLVDMPILKRVGLPITVADAPMEVKEKALYVTQKRGGQGALREIIELILKAQGKFKKAVDLVTKDTYQDD